MIVDKIDEDSDGFITVYELQIWIKYSQRRYIDKDVANQWKVHNTNGSEKLHWEVSSGSGDRMRSCEYIRAMN